MVAPCDLRGAGLNTVLLRPPANGGDCVFRDRRYRTSCSMYDAYWWGSLQYADYATSKGITSYGGHFTPHYQTISGLLHGSIYVFTG